MTRVRKLGLTTSPGSSGDVLASGLLAQAYSSLSLSTGPMPFLLVFLSGMVATVALLVLLLVVMRGGRGRREATTPATELFSAVDNHEPFVE